MSLERKRAVFAFSSSISFMRFSNKIRPRSTLSSIYLVLVLFYLLRMRPIKLYFIFLTNSINISFIVILITFSVKKRFRSMCQKSFYC